jgi:hypothetical protein
MDVSTLPAATRMTQRDIASGKCFRLVRPGTNLQTLALDKPVDAIFTLNEPTAWEWQMRSDEPLFVGSEPIEEAQTSRYSAVGLMVDWDFPRWILE